MADGSMQTSHEGCSDSSVPPNLQMEENCFLDSLDVYIASYPIIQGIRQEGCHELDWETLSLKREIDSLQASAAMFIS